MGFALYPVERHWWSFADYGAVLDVMARLRPATVLEFGPGSSTLALVEGGARRIDSCEDDPAWMATARKLLAPHLAVELYGYTWNNPLSIRWLDWKAYDFALVDGPAETARRLACVEYCLRRALAVLVPLEETPAARGAGYLRPRVLALADEHRRSVELIEDTGPLAGAWALLTC